jgi:hypothetical protein
MKTTRVVLVVLAIVLDDGGFLPMVQCSPFDGSTIAGRLPALAAVPMFAEVSA